MKGDANYPRCTAKHSNAPLRPSPENCDAPSTNHWRQILQVSFTGVQNELRLNELPIFSGTEENLLSKLREISNEGGKCLVVTPNVDQVLNLRRDREFYDAFASASLRLIDGAPLLALAKLLGVTGATRNTGADLLSAVSTHPMFAGTSVAIAGGNPAAAQEAAHRLQSNSLDRRITAVKFPFLTATADSQSLDVIARLNREAPAFVFLCLGSPKQELWYRYWEDQLPNAIYIGAGAAVDFSAGRMKRAPKLLQKLGLEWLYRVHQEPSRLWRRYFLKGPAFIPIALRSIIRQARSAPVRAFDTSATASSDSSGETSR